MTKKKKILALVAVAVLTLALAIPCFAEGETSSSGIPSSITSAMTTSFQQIASDALSVLAIIVPIALSIVGVVWVTKKAIRWFQQMGSPR